VNVLGRSGECPKQNPQGGCLFLRESKRERGKERTLVGLEKRKGCLLHLHPVTWDLPARGTCGQSTEPTRTVCVVPRRSGAPARTVRYLFQNIQYCPSPHRAARTVCVALADGLPGADGQSGPPPRTVRPSFSFSA
jgi:hypothetical protein